MKPPNYPRGHPRTPENTYTKLCAGRTLPLKYYKCTYCKTCDNRRALKYRKKKPDYNRLYLRDWRRRKRLGIVRSKCRLEQAWSPACG